MPNDVTAGRWLIAPPLVAPVMLCQAIEDRPSAPRGAGHHMIKGRRLRALPRHSLAPTEGFAAASAKEILSLAKSIELIALCHPPVFAVLSSHAYITSVSPPCRH